MAATILGAATVAIWLYLICFRGGFWRPARPAPDPLTPPARRVVAVVPARNEALLIAPAVASLLANTQVRVNGVGVGPTAALVIAGTSLSDQVTFSANATDTLQLVVGGLALTLGTGDNATINIDKVQ